jgi:pSer/pThr/pTyr-binding forkhead associated (FHA) protein
VDADRYGEPHPDAPVGHPAQTFTLFDPESLIGRPASAVRVQVPVGHDPGVSRRQAVLIRRPDGTLVVRDLGSANGTQLNGRELLAGVDEPLKDGDALAVGAWTKITVREVRS